MLFPKRSPRLTKQEALRVKPMRMVTAALMRKEDGSATLKVPLPPGRRVAWFFKIPDGLTKTFELDALGLLVWESCDGKTTVQQVIRKLAKRYHFSLREAEVSTLSFLTTLVKKGLIGMPVRDSESSKKGD